MCHCYNNIGTLCLHNRNKLCCCFSNVLSNDFTFQINLVPFHNLRGHKTKYTDFNIPGLVIAIQYLLFDNNKRFKSIYVIIWIVIFIINIYIGIHIGEIGTSQWIIMIAFNSTI
ncbi:hypothetical protein D3C76_640230 [compost metagenome]